MVVSCPFLANDAARQLQFTANFGGSHDDTKLSLKATLDGAPLVCAPGSKTSSTYEDGDISLQCRFRAEAGAGTRQVLAVRLQWHHAQFIDSQFGPE